MMCLVMSALIATLTDTSGRVPSSLAETATYFTFQANLIAMVAWGTLVFYQWRPGPQPRWLEYGRAFTAANLVTIGAIYWLAIAPLGMQDGPQLIFVMIVSHVVTPLYAAAEQLLVGPRTPLPWRDLWMIVGYASGWVTIAVTKSLLGATSVYEYLDPARGFVSVGFGLLWNFAVLAAAASCAMRIRRWRRWSDAGASAHVQPAGVSATEIPLPDDSDGPHGTDGSDDPDGSVSVGAHRTSP